jgi:hypothetical protein
MPPAHFLFLGVAAVTHLALGVVKRRLIGRFIAERV